MALYELRRGGRPVERIRTVPRSFEDTRLGLQAAHRERHAEKDGWHRLDETGGAPSDGQATGAKGTGKATAQGG